jgi:hypothetical protein
MSTVVRSEDALDKHLAKMDLVVGEYLKGLKPHEIATTLGMSTASVGLVLKDWRALASNNEAMKTRGMTALRTADQHFDKLIKITYGILEDAEQAESLNARLSAVKMIADIEKVRIEQLQKAGVLEDADMSKELIETQRKQEILMTILKDTVGPCNRCRPIVQYKLA